MPRLSKIGAACLSAFGFGTGGAAVTASYLVVAGGGGGGTSTFGNANGGGGGAGGLVPSSASLSLTTTYTVIVGAGGSANTSGSNSSISSVVTAIGGGFGGNSTTAIPAVGGSGGGGSSTPTGSTGAAGTSGQGYAGGNGITSGKYAGGGGGGAGSVGSNATTTAAGNGGSGYTSSISGSSVAYAGGGGAGADSGATGGTAVAGGGAGGIGIAGSNGTSNLGGGGGGAGAPSGTLLGGQGGSGVVIVAYAGAQKFGGGIVSSDGTNTIHTFKTSGQLVPMTPITASYLIVAGGGGGGSGINFASNGGGGGAGGMLTGSTLSIDTSSTYIVTVGSGGTGGSSSAGTNGTSSSFSIVSTTALGGGYGGYNGSVGAAGGSGGGGSDFGTGGAGTTGQGYAGAGGGGGHGNGGGGAGAVGSSANGTGGTGVASSISGTSTYYAGGGGGGNDYARTASANGGGGTGAWYPDASGGGAGTANTGGGGGGGASRTASAPGGNGGSGIVVISYAGTTQLMAGGTVTIRGGNVIHTFTSSGYLTPLTFIGRSLRFRSSGSTYLSRTITAVTNPAVWTWSAWIKRGTLGTVQEIISSSNGTPNQCSIQFNSSDQIRVINYISSTFATQYVTTQVFRDPAAWYHVVVSQNSSTSFNLYINGTRVTSFGTATGPNTAEWLINQVGRTINIGKEQLSGGANYFDGYMADVRFIDGQALTPNSFGTFNSYGVWQPINYGGSYGTNGFHLPFSDTTSTTTLVADKSPQGNNWTPNNISLTTGSTYDSMTDVPTLTSTTAANYCVMNPLDKGSGLTLSNGNLTVSGTTSSVRGSFGLSTGKWYWEVTIGTVGNPIGIMKAQGNLGAYPGSDANGWGYNDDGNKYTNGAATAYGATYTSGNVIGIAFDADNGTLTYYKNGTSQGTAFTGLTSGPYFPAVGAALMNLNFGQQPFAYTPPTGYVALNTYNL